MKSPHSWFYLFAGTALISGSFSVCAEEKVMSENDAVMPERHFELFEKYCLECHDSLTEKGEINLEELSFRLIDDIETAETWNRVLNSINSGEMPPEDETPISNEEKTNFLRDLSENMVTARSILSDSGGEITLRRLNRREYANTIEDLLGVRPEVSSLPDDQASAEFDTMGASLFLSSDQLELYLETASRTLKLALSPGESEAEPVVRIEPEEIYTPLYLELAQNLLDRAQRNYAWQATGGRDENSKEFGYLDGWQAGKQLNSFHQYFPQVAKYLDAPETKDGAALMLTIKDGFTQIKLPGLKWNDGGKYTIRVRVGAYEDAPDRFQYLEFSRKIGQNTERLGYRKVKGTLRKPEVIEFEIDHPVGMSATYSVHKRTHEDRGDKNLWVVYRRENGFGTPWGLWVDWAELDRNEEQKPLSKVDEILFERKEAMTLPEYNREVIHRFAERALRGSEPDPGFLEKLYVRFDAGREQGMAPREALIQPLSIILSSPSFLYLVESTEGEGDSLSGQELASRLSYFLWSSPPDSELLALAKAGELSNSGVLKDQVDRLLADPRSENFVQAFVYQWLDMHRLGMFAFSGLQFPDFDNAVRDSARDEVFETVSHAIRDGASLQTLLKSNSVVINDVLADYYGIDGVEGHEFRAVQVPEGSPRGGLLGTVAVAAMGSDGIRSSPVERGAWVLRHLLNNPPPPAPPNVPQLSRLEGEVFSARELQKAHQEQAQCAQCHQKIDPIGYGLENFDASGRWREIELVTSGKRGNVVTEFPVEPAGKLVDGASFDSYYDLRDIVAERTDAFAMGLTEALISYGMGRPFGFSDAQLAHEIVSEASKADYQISAFIHALVQSTPFQSR
ncbi:MAG: DUF1592 domain-containing protein [Verrucomicrobiales bacterium]|nr:DUF1592 domain-containing protein [Verrucomicrobiales bacterium]